jgi:hypothetical protein
MQARTGTCAAAIEEIDRSPGAESTTALSVIEARGQ